MFVFVGCLTSQQQASVSQGRICSDDFACCHTEIEVADQAFYLTQSQYTDTGPTSPSADPITPGAWQGSHWSANFEVPGRTRPRKNPVASGIRTRDLPVSRRTPYHLANEAVWQCRVPAFRKGVCDFTPPPPPPPHPHMFHSVSNHVAFLVFMRLFCGPRPDGTSKFSVCGTG